MVASPPSSLYRLQKFVRKHRAAVAGAKARSARDDPGRGRNQAVTHTAVALIHFYFLLGPYARSMSA